MNNPEYTNNLKKVYDAVGFKNKHVVSTFMGSAVPPTYTENITLAEYMNDTDKGLQCFLDFMERMGKEAPIECINFGYPGGHEVGLTLIWWSRVKMPGRELPPDAVWQVDEKKLIEDEDYDLILEKGTGPITDRMISSFLDAETMQKFSDYQEKVESNFEKYAEAGLPVLCSSGLLCPPFETLCGGRSMGAFFMDCYKDIDKIKAVQDVMMEEIRNNLSGLKKSDYHIGCWVGGWRGASNMVNQKIWDTLVWPCMKEMAEIVISKGLIPIMHLDANWDRDIARFLELPAQKFIINTDGMTDLRNARKVLGNHAALMGDVPSQMLTVSSKQEIKDYCRSLLDDIGPEGVFLTAGCDAPTVSKYENLVAIHEVCQEY